MSALEGDRRSRDGLPSIHSLDFEKPRIDKTHSPQHPSVNGLSVSTAHTSSPTAAYSAPPPPYSNAGSAVGSAHSLPGYISPPETASRRNTRDDKDSPNANKSLPSIFEALKSADVPQSAQSFNSSAPPSAANTNFSDAPRGPGNPFSQHSAPSVAARTSVSSNAALPDVAPNVLPPTSAASESRSSQVFGSATSPRSAVTHARPPSLHEPPVFRSAFETEAVRPGYSYSDHNSPYSVTQPPSSTNFTFENRVKFDERQNPFAKPSSVPYGETVKRHLDGFEAELALKEISEASAITSEFAKIWSQRYHSANRGTYYAEALPPVSSVDDMIQQTHRMLHYLEEVRKVSLMQQASMREQRAQAARHEDNYHGLPDDYRSGGFAGGDAKKRRGKAATPGRCHSCNRAETPEWRRGPDGARTLCNACGLHYAKLTRKMGASKAAHITTSNLRPKSLGELQP